MGHHKSEVQGRTVGALEGRVQESLSKLQCFIAKIVGNLATVKLACTMCSARRIHDICNLCTGFLKKKNKRRPPPVLKSWWELMVFVHWTSPQLVFGIPCTVQHYFCSVPTLGIDMIHLILNNYPFKSNLIINGMDVQHIDLLHLKDRAQNMGNMCTTCI